MTEHFYNCFLSPVKIKRMHKDAIIPEYSSDGAACFDLYAVEDVSLRRHDVKAIRSGWAMEIPAGYYGEIFPRSSLAVKGDLIIPNSPCIIDSDYRGEIITYMRCAANVPDGWYTVIRKGDRYAQMMLKKYIIVDFKEVDELGDTNRGSGGFGSTGK